MTPSIEIYKNTLLLYCEKLPEDMQADFMHTVRSLLKACRDEVDNVELATHSARNSEAVIKVER